MEPLGAAPTVVVAVPARVVEEFVEVVVVVDDEVVEEDAFFDVLEHALSTTRREKNPRNATETSPNFFAFTTFSFSLVQSVIQ